MKVNLDGEVSIRYHVSHLPGVTTAVGIEAEEIAIRAKGRLAKHKPGKDAAFGPSRVTVTHGDTDSFVNLEDPAAMHIEFGAPSRGVAGLYIITGAAGFLD